MVGPLLFLLQHALPRGAILQGKLTQDLAEAMNADLAHSVHWMAQEQQEGVKPAEARNNRPKIEFSTRKVTSRRRRLHRPVDYSPVHNLQNDDPLRAVLEEVRHLLLQRRLHLVFGNDLEVIP